MKKHDFERFTKTFRFSEMEMTFRSQVISMNLEKMDRYSPISNIRQKCDEEITFSTPRDIEKWYIKRS